MTVEELIDAMKALVEAATAEDRELTDEEADRYEQLEGQLTAARRSREIQTRQAAYEAPAVNFVKTAVRDGRTDEDRAFEHYLRTGQPNSDLEFRAQSVGTTTAGGYTVPEGFRNKITEKLLSFGGVQTVAETITTESGNPLPWPTNDDTSNTAELVAENAAPASAGADLVFGVKTLGAYKIVSEGTGNLPLKVSVELLQDSAFNVEDLVARKLAMRIARKEAAYFASGTGSGEPQGILTGGTSSDEITTQATGATYAELVAAVHVVDAAYRDGGQCHWVMHDGILAKIEQLVDGASRPLIYDQATSGIGNKPGKFLLGYPVVIDNSFPSTWGDAAKTVVFGDISSGYVIRRVKDFQLVVLHELYAVNGQVAFMGWTRVDALTQDAAAYTVISGQNT